MSNLYEEYRDPLIMKWYTDESGDKTSIQRTNEQIKVLKNVAVLTEIPDEFYHVQISGMTEIYSGTPNVNEFIVNYTNGFITFNPSQEGRTLTINSYYARGVIMYPSSRIWYEVDLNGDVQTTLNDLVLSIQEYSYKGVYDNAINYENNNIVYYQGSTYICTVLSTIGNKPTDSSKWRLLAAGLEYIGTYSNSIQYYERNVVTDNNEIFICIKTPAIGTATSNTAYWLKIFTAKQILLDAQTAIDNANIAITNVNTAKDNAITATTNANNAKDATITATTNANTATTNANTAITNINTLSTNLSLWETYNNSKQYYVQNKVTYNGSCYVCILQPPISTNPTNTTYWLMIAQKGTDGAGGDVTLTGVQTLTNKTLTSPVIDTPTITGANLSGAVKEGTGCTASGTDSHAEGNSTISSGFQSHAEGCQTIASSNYAHSEGYYSVASTNAAHAEGQSTLACTGGVYSITNYNNTLKTITLDKVTSLAVSNLLTIKVTGGKAVENIPITAINGLIVTLNTTATITSSWSMAIKKVSSGASHTEGGDTVASGIYSHAEGMLSIASGDYSHAEGAYNSSGGAYSHAEGGMTFATGMTAHSEGNTTIASGDNSHAEGEGTVAGGIGSHAQNYYTKAQGKSQTAIGEYNVAQGTASTKLATDQAFIIGNGTSDVARSNAFSVNWQGDTILGNISPLPKAMLFGARSVNDWLEFNIQNTNAGTLASSDFVATANNGTSTTNFVNMGINSSAFTDATFTIVQALGAYLFNNGGDMAIGTGTATKILKLFTGGTLTANERMRIEDTLATHYTDVTVTKATPAIKANAVGATWASIIVQQDGTDKWALNKAPTTHTFSIAECGVADRMKFLPGGEIDIAGTLLLNNSSGRQFGGNWVDLSGCGGGMTLYGNNCYYDNTTGQIKYSNSHGSLGARGISMDWGAPGAPFYFDTGNIACTKDALVSATRYKLWHEGNLKLNSRPLVSTTSLTFYVNPQSGNDSNNGATSGTAFATFAKAMSLVPHVINSGHVVAIKLIGTFTENLYISNVSAHSRDNFIITRDSVTPTINSWIEVKNVNGLSISYLSVSHKIGNECMSFYGCRDIVISGTICERTGTIGALGTDVGICITRCTGFELANNTFTNSKTSECLYIVDSTGISYNSTGLATRYGIAAFYGCTIVKTGGNQPTGAVANESMQYGGVIK